MNEYVKYLDKGLLAEVESFILSHWEETVRVRTEDEGTLIGLPFPYTIPSRKDAFQELYYWDTYFTSVGLLRSGRGDLALSNTRNLLFLARKYGYVPNGNRTFYLNRSQPPYLCALVEKVAAETGNTALLREALPVLQQEYHFWIEKRGTALGLCRYGNQADRAELVEFYKEVAPRTGIAAPAEESLPRLSQVMAECESGCDFTPRFEDRCLDFCPVDLNCLLHQYETFFARHGDPAEKPEWMRAADQRLRLINEFCWDEERGGFFDYDHVRNCRGTMVTAWLQPLWTGLATRRQAELIKERILPKLEFPFGIATCEPQVRQRPYQWDFPNGWPCLQHIAYAGFLRYGYKDVALRIARKYLATVARCFRETGDLWEKYNVEDGSTRTVTEPGYALGTYRDAAQSEPLAEAPSMMGWSAGVFLDALALHRSQDS